MRVARFVAGLVLCASIASAQTFRGGIQGTVTDQTDAALPGVDRDRHERRHRPEPIGRDRPQRQLLLLGAAARRVHGRRPAFPDLRRRR